jgi:hypothetical protein
MTMKRRIDRLERETPEFYADVTEIPTRVLDAMLRQAHQNGDWPKTKEEESLCKALEDLGFNFSAPGG